ncbi:MAG: DUF2961 domain-containing protein, partial [Acidobacteriota bacterium]|nr:DUF2961 domain-containing protein [Acidobacteriota bacterium]
MKRRNFLVGLGGVAIINACRKAGVTLAIFPAVRGKRAAEPPVIPVGLDAYRMWDRWPYQRVGVRAYMASTYDRGGGNEGADASHFLYQLSDNFNVTMDVEGAGVLYFARFNRWHGSPWHFQVDGADYIVEESSTADPLHPARNSTFIPQPCFPRPLCLNWSETKGSDLIWAPVAFERSFRMAYERTHYGTGYYIYHRYAAGAAPLSQPIRSWNESAEPANDVLELIERSGSDPLKAEEKTRGRQIRIEKQKGVSLVPAKGSAVISWIEEGPAMIRALDFSIARDRAIEFGRLRLRITWDGRPHASIDAPVALFFGAGTLYNRSGREYLVKAFPAHI